VFIFPNIFVAGGFPNIVAAVNQMILDVLSAVTTSATADWAISFKVTPYRCHWLMLADYSQRANELVYMSLSGWLKD
jgi:hypothetical protein